MSLQTNEGGIFDNFFGVSIQKNKKKLRNEQDNLYNTNQKITNSLGNFYQDFNTNREKATIGIMGDEYADTLQDTSDTIKKANSSSIANIKRAGGSNSSSAMTSEIVGERNRIDALNKTKFGMQNQAMSTATGQAQNIFGMNTSSLGELGNRYGVENAKKSGLEQLSGAAIDIGKSFAGFSSPNPVKIPL